MRNLGRATAVLGLVLAATLALAGPAGAAGAAGAAGKVGPSQYFTGVVNGTNGNTSTPIPIRVVCHGSSPTGHPAKGQTLAVHQLFPPAQDGSLGYTGNDSEIGVFSTVGGPDPGGRWVDRLHPLRQAEATPHLGDRALRRDEDHLVRPHRRRPSFAVGHRPRGVRQREVARSMAT
jgi:hypothetical protein